MSLCYYFVETWKACLSDEEKTRLKLDELVFPTGLVPSVERKRTEIMCGWYMFECIPAFVSLLPEIGRDLSTIRKNLDSFPDPTAVYEDDVVRTTVRGRAWSKTREAVRASGWGASKLAIERVTGREDPNLNYLWDIGWDTTEIVARREIVKSEDLIQSTVEKVQKSALELYERLVTL